MRANRSPHHSLTHRPGLATALILALLLPACSKSDVPEPQPKNLNVLLVTLDTTRADRLSCYGHPLQTSPNLDQLAKEGIRFDFAISQAALTPVSHASILTGLNPAGHGVRVVYAASGCRLQDSAQPLATVLGERGWRTGAFLSSFTVSEFFGFDKGFDTFDSGLAGNAESMLEKRANGFFQWNEAQNQRRSDRTTDQFLAWLEADDKPFFAWLHYWDPHDRGLIPPPAVLQKFVSASPQSEQGRRQVYDAEAFFVDAQLGRLVQALRSKGIYDNTIIVVIADHGEGLGDHGHWYHRILYQEQIRVPLVIRIPDGPSNHVVPELVRGIDVFPTILQWLGIAPPMPIDGKSLLPLIRGESEPPRIAYADALNLFDLNAVMLKRRPNDDLLYCAMDRSWKLIYRSRRPEESELYHLASDPAELSNLFGQANDQSDRLLAELKKFDAFVDQPFGVATDPEILEKLRSLGYVGGEESEPDPSP